MAEPTQEPGHDRSQPDQEETTEDWLRHLVRSVEDVEEAVDFLAEPWPQLGGLTPLEAIRDGRQEDVADLVFDLY